VRDRHHCISERNDRAVLGAEREHESAVYST
jgi:hypothetical protein